MRVTTVSSWWEEISSRDQDVLVWIVRHMKRNSMYSAPKWKVLKINDNGEGEIDFVKLQNYFTHQVLRIMFMKFKNMVWIKYSYYYWCPFRKMNAQNIPLTIMIRSTQVGKMWYEYITYSFQKRLCAYVENLCWKPTETLASLARSIKLEVLEKIVVVITDVRVWNSNQNVVNSLVREQAKWIEKFFILNSDSNFQNLRQDVSWLQHPTR